MSLFVIRVRLHELFLRLPRNISTHQISRHFTRSCTLSDAGDRSRGSWYKTTQQESSGKQRRLENSTTDESEFESSDSRAFTGKRPRITKPTVPVHDTHMSEQTRFRRNFESPQESFGDEEPSFWPTQAREKRMNSGQEKFSAGRKNFRNTERGPASENSARSGKWVADRQTNFKSSRESFADEEPSFWQTHAHENQMNSGQEKFSAGRKNFRNTERAAASENFVRSGKWVADKQTKNYNYGLTGLGKELPQKLKASPAVKGEILYGIHSALLALLADRREFHKFYIRDSLVESEKPALQQLMSLVREKKVNFEACNKSLLTSLSQARPHQGVCLDAGHLDYETLGSNESFYEDSSNNTLEPRLFVILDSVQDPMNLGAVIRSSYFLGVDQLFVVKENSCSLTPVVSKSSSGAMEISKIYAIPDLVEFLEDFKERGWDLLGTTSSPKSNPEQVVSLKDVSLKRNTILILGNEGSGLTEAVESRCHRLITIPPGRNLHPLVDCLNVSVATGIILHHLCQFKMSSKTVA